MSRKRHYIRSLEYNDIFVLICVRFLARTLVAVGDTFENLNNMNSCLTFNALYIMYEATKKLKTESYLCMVRYTHDYNGTKRVKYKGRYRFLIL